MTWKSGLLVLVALGSLAADAAPAARKVRTLAQGHDCAVTAPSRQVARTQAQYESLWKRHLPPRVSGQAPKSPPKVDFRKEMVLAVFMGRKPTGGYAVQVTGAREEAGKLRVTVEERVPPPGALTIQMLTAPYHFAAVEKSALPVEWRGVRAKK